MKNYELPMIVYKRLFFLASKLDEKEFISRAEELIYLLKQDNEDSDFPGTNRK